MKVIEKTLPNGLRVVMVPQADAATATVLILVGAGSKYETKRENGLSHFLEHMFFKGTTLRPTAKIISEQLDNLGAVSNAFTSHEYTGYYVKGNPKHTETFIDVLSDIYLHSLFSEKEIEKEKGVIIEEINMYEDMPQHKVWDVLFATMYGDQPVGWPISGTKEHVRNFSRKDFLRYQKEHYTSSNTVITIAGAFDEKKIFAAIKKQFGTVAMTDAKDKKKVRDTQKAFQQKVFHRKTDQAHLALGFRSPALGHKDGPTASLLATMLGGGMSARLFQELREELGVAYYVRAEHDPFTDHGMFTISAGITTNRLTEVLDCIVAVLQDLKNNPINKEELTKIQEYSVGMMRLGLESSDSIAGFYGSQLLLKKGYKTPEQLTKEYLSVTPEDLKRVAKKIFVSTSATLVLVGPFDEKKLIENPLKNL